MNVENRLREAFAAERAEGAEPTPRKWSSVRDRARSNRSRRRAQQFIVIGLSAAAVAAVIVGVMIGGGKEQSAEILDEPPVGGGEDPAYVVTAEERGVFVRSSTNGEVLRELVPASDAGNLQRVAVAPDGSYVYFERAVDERCLRSEIVRVPIGGGAIELVVRNGSHPVISPSGNYLAYVSNGSTDACADGSLQLFRRTIGAEGSDMTIATVDTTGNALFPIGWSENERWMLAETPRFESAAAGPSLQLLEGVDRGTTGVRDVRFPKEGEQETPAVFVGPEIAAAFMDGAVVSFETRTGEIADRIFELPRRPAALEVDASGTRFLAMVEAPDGYTIYRWDSDNGLKSLGDTRVRDLAWARGPLTHPKHFVAVTPDGKLQIRETLTGEVLRTLREGIDVSGGGPTLSTATDSRYVYMDVGAGQPCDGGQGPQIVRIDTVSGAQEVVAEGEQPDVSPDGYQIAYVSGPCGGPEELVVRFLGDGPERRYTSGSGNIDSPHWSPDNRHLIVSSGTADGFEAQTRLLDTVEPDSSSLDDADIVGASNYGFLDIDELLGNRPPVEDTTEIVSLRVGPADEQDRAIFKQPGVHDPVTMGATDDGQHVFVVLRAGQDFGAVRYSIGAIDSRQLANDVVAVAWLENLPTEQPRSTAQPTRPARF